MYERHNILYKLYEIAAGKAAERYGIAAGGLAGRKPNICIGTT